jgi:hypothetical protein
MVELLLAQLRGASGFLGRQCDGVFATLVEQLGFAAARLLSDPDRDDRVPIGEEVGVPFRREGRFVKTAMAVGIRLPALPSPLCLAFIPTSC